MGVAVVLPLLLAFGGYHPSATAAAKKAHEGFRLGGVLRRGTPPAAIQNRIRSIKKLFGDDRLVLAFMQFAGVEATQAIFGQGHEVGALAK